MEKSLREQLKKERIELLDAEILKLEKEIEYIQNRHNQKMKELEAKLDMLKFEKDIFGKTKI